MSDDKVDLVKKESMSDYKVVSAQQANIEKHPLTN